MSQSTSNQQPPGGNGTHIGVAERPYNVRVRDYWHLTECRLAMWPEYPDEKCTCHDESPEWTT